MQITDLYKVFLKHPAISTDTRSIAQGSLFFALRGEKFNGNEFAHTALEAGAAYAVVDDNSIPLSPRIIQVENALNTLQSLAAHHRNQFHIPVIAVTGSNGKTTTKELLAAVLTKKYSVHFTKGNLNNHIGIPLTILQMDRSAEIAVIEMGANHQHEIESYCSYTRPTHGLITNIGKAHLEGFGGEEGVEKGKTELFRYLEKVKGTIFYNADSEKLKRNLSERTSNFAYGSRSSFFVSGAVLESGPFLKMEIRNGNEVVQVSTRLFGSYNAENVLAAACVGHFFNIALVDCCQAIASYHPQNNRSQLSNQENNTLILDSYNANPSSMEQAIENFAAQKEENKIMVLGDMLELGSSSETEHKRILELALSKKCKVIFIGPSFYNLKNEQGLFFENNRQAADWWKTADVKNAYVLLKGSRGIAVEKILDSKE